MAQITSNSVGGLFDGDFIDLTDEIDRQNVLSEDDDVLILDTSKPMEDLTTEINEKLKSSQNELAKRTVTNKTAISKIANLVTQGPTRLIVREHKTNNLTVKKQISELNAKSLEKDLNAAPKQILDTTNSKKVYLLKKSVSAKFDGAGKIRPVQIGTVILGVNDVSAPSSTEIQNKQLPKDPLITNSEGDVTFVKHLRMKMKPLVQNKSNLGLTTPNDQRRLLLPKSVLMGAEPKSEKLVELLQDVRILPATSTLNPVNKPGAVSCDKNATVVNQSVSKQVGPNSLSADKSKTSNVVLQNWLDTKVFKQKSQKPSNPMPSTLQKKSPISQFVIKNVYSKSTTPIKPTVRQEPQKIKQLQSQNRTSNNSDEDIICLSDLKEGTPQPKPRYAIIKASSRSEAQTKNVVTAPSQNSPSDDVEEEIPANTIVAKSFHYENILKKTLQVPTHKQSLLKTAPPHKIKLNVTKKATPTASHSLADIVETASAVANITANGNGEKLVGASEKGNLVFLLYPLNAETGDTVSLKDGQVKQMLALVPSDSALAPPKLVPLTPKDGKETSEAFDIITLDDFGNVKEVEQEYIIPNDPLAKENVLKESSTKDAIEFPSAVVTPVDIRKILNRGKRKQIPGRCENNEAFSGVYLKGFKKNRLSSCIVQMKSIKKEEEKKVNSMRKSFKRRYESNFIACGRATNYFLPETVKTEIEETEDVTFESNNILEQLHETENLPTISDVISKVNKEVFQMKNKQDQTGNKSVNDRPPAFKTAQALKLIKQGLEMIQSWSQESGSSERTKLMPTKVGKLNRINTKAVADKASEPPSITPVTMKRRGRPKKNHKSGGDVEPPVMKIGGRPKKIHKSGEDVESRVVKSRGRPKKIHKSGEDIEPRVEKRGRKRNHIETNVVSSAEFTNVSRFVEENVNMIDSDDLLVVKRVDIINDSAMGTKVKRRKQIFPV